MGECPAWAEIKDRFEPDGSLRDIYVLKTTRDDWEKFIAFIAASPFAPVMSKDDQQIPLELFPEFPDYPKDGVKPQLRFVVAGMLCCCHFFGDEEIEFDINPAEVKGEYEYNSLLDFLVQLRDVMSKDVVLTEENCSPDNYAEVYGAVILRLPANRELN